MLKTSPSLLLLLFVMRREWRAVFAAAASALGLSLVSLVLVPYGAQRYFYTNNVLLDFAGSTLPGSPFPSDPS